MNLENQVCSLELSKRLKEIGVKQKSVVYWIKVTETDRWELLFNGDDDFSSIQSWIIDECAYSAFSCAELGELLPNCIVIPELAPHDNYRLTIRKIILVDEKINQTNNFLINYECDSTETSGIYAWIQRRLFNIYDQRLSNAIANTIIYLLENKLMELPNET